MRRGSATAHRQRSLRSRSMNDVLEYLCSNENLHRHAADTTRGRSMRWTIPSGHIRAARPTPGGDASV